MKAFQKRIEDEIKKLQTLKEIYASKDGWIVESENHVNIGDGNGLNGTAFAVKSPMSCSAAVVWNTKEDAEKYGADYYLIDGANKPIYMRFTKAVDFFSKEIDKYKEMLIFIKENQIKNEI